MPDHAPQSGSLSLEGMHSSVDVPHHEAGFWSSGVPSSPAVLISVGHMDPGNFTSSGAQLKHGLVGSRRRQRMAIFMRPDPGPPRWSPAIAQACRDWYPNWTRWPNWLFSESATRHAIWPRYWEARSPSTSCSTSLLWAVIITGLDVLPLLGLQSWHAHHRGGGCCRARPLRCYHETLVLPQTSPASRSWLVPGTQFHRGHDLRGHRDIGARHAAQSVSALRAVQSRRLQKDDKSMRRAIQFNTIDSTVALWWHFVNAAILVLAAMVFGKERCYYLGGRCTSRRRATDSRGRPHSGAAVGNHAASTLFAVALLASGQSSTITGTLAGQVVMEGFMRWRIKPWVRRLITRSLAILPAVFIIGVRGEGSVTDLLTLSQVVLALQLPFAMFPLLHFTGSRKRMGTWRNGWFLTISGWTSAILITAMDIYGLPESMRTAWQIVIGK